MRKIYLVDNLNIQDDSFLEYLNKDDKVYFILSNLSNIKKNFLKELSNKPFLQNVISVEHVSSNLEDVLDFRIIPVLIQICYENKDSEIVLVSSNPKLACLKGYFEEYLGFNIEIAPSIQFYNVAHYINELLHLNDFNISSEILHNIIRHRQLDISILSNRKIRKKLAKKQDIINKLNFLAYDFKILDSELFISFETTATFIDKISDLRLGLNRDDLKKVAYFLHKSDTFKSFKERINSCNNLTLNKEEKEELLAVIEEKLIKNEL